MKICSVEGCGKKFYAKGLCANHYKQRQATGVPEKLAKRRKWYAKNKERILEKQRNIYHLDPEPFKARNKAFNKKNADSINARRRAKYAANPEIGRQKTVAWEKANPEKVKASKRAHSKKRSKHIMARVKKWVRSNPEKRKANVSKWDKAHPDHVNAKHAKRRATKLNATPTWANTFFIREAYALAKLRTKMFGFKWEVDHIVPLQSKIVCGLHVENNLRVVPLRDNRTKSNTIWPNMPT